MCLENQQIIGVRGLCEVGETYKYYLDDLNGITYQNLAKTAVASQTASSLFTTAIQEGIKGTISDILFSTPSPIQFNNISNVYYHRDFTETIQTGFVGSRGLTVSINRSTQIQYSSPVVRTIYIKTATDTTDLIINVISNGVVVYTETIPTVVAGSVYTLSPNVTIKESSFSIEFDQTSIDVYQAAFNSDYQCCGKVSNYINGFDYLLNKSLGRFRVTGGFGVSADIDLACDEEKLTCTLLPYFGEEVRWKAGIYLANAVLVSDRLTLFTINNKEDILQLAESWNAEYQTKLKRKASQVLNSLRGTDSCCFKQMGITRGVQLV